MSVVVLSIFLVILSSFEVRNRPVNLTFRGGLIIFSEPVNLFHMKKKSDFNSFDMKICHFSSNLTQFTNITKISC
jgi:hypothetical protein